MDQIPANRRMRFWVCEACLAPLPEDAGRAISDLSHRRFLDKTRRGVNALRSFAITMARMRLDLEEAYVFGEERAQLKATRRARGRAALEDLGFRRDPPEEPQPDPISRP